MLDSEKSITILNECVDRRIAHYKSWQVADEYTDLILLQQIVTVASDDNIYSKDNVRNKLLQKAFDLFTVAYTRYKKSLDYHDGQTPLNLYF